MPAGTNHTIQALLFLALLVTGCARKPTADPGVAREIERSREVKDRSFRDPRQSPLPDSVRRYFAGLSYYPVDLRYRLRVKLKKYRRPQRIEIVTSRGLKRAALRYGEFRFKLLGKSLRLQVYKLLDLQAEHRRLLFVPFTDATSGTETYAGGRYLDIEETPDDVYTLDFNLAYNPYCAYNHNFDCPIPPEENHLPVPVRAGEKAFSVKQRPAP